MWICLIDIVFVGYIYISTRVLSNTN